MTLEGKNELINPYSATSTTAHYKTSGLRVTGNNARLTIKGDGSLIAVSNIKSGGIGAGIMVDNGGKLDITGGTITAVGSGIADHDEQRTGAGIGVLSGTLNITGGTVIAVGGNGGAGIGGVFMGNSNFPQTVGTINISGGVVIARGQDRSTRGGGGAGIGGGGRESNPSTGYPGYNSYSGGQVQITGGVVIAEGGDGQGETDHENISGGAGIGGGGRTNSVHTPSGDDHIGGGGGNVIIVGGTVYAKGGQDAYGIGPGKGSSATQPYGVATNLIISGPGRLVFASSIKSISGTYDAGNSTLNNANANGVLVGSSSPLTAALPNEVEFPATSGRLITFDSNTSTPNGARYDVDIPDGHFPSFTVELTALNDFTVPVPPGAPPYLTTFTIPSYMTFTIVDTATLTNNSTVNNYGILKNNGTVNNYGILNNYGTVQNNGMVNNNYNGMNSPNVIHSPGSTWTGDYPTNSP